MTLPKSDFFEDTPDPGESLRATWGRSVVQLLSPLAQTDAEEAAGVTPTNYEYPPGHVLRYGTNTTPGTTDMAAAIQAAVDQCAQGGATVFIPSGTYSVATGIDLKDKVSIDGAGYATVIQRASTLDDDLFSFSATNLDYTGIQIRNLYLDGNKSAGSPTSASRGIALQNNTGTSTLLAYHVLDNVIVRNFNGTGIYLGAYIRESTFRNLRVYACDDYGVFAEGTGDCHFEDIIVGQSGLAGFYIKGTGANTWVNCKGWYSGRLTVGSNANFYIHNASFQKFVGCESQESYGHGWSVWGQSGSVTMLEMFGCVSDSDNLSAGSYNALNLNNVDGANIELSVRRYGSTGQVVYGMGHASLTNSTIDLQIDSGAISSYPINGTVGRTNSVRTNWSEAVKDDVGNSAATLVAGRDPQVQVWNTPLTADRAVTLDASHAIPSTFRIVRTAAATGAFNLNVGTGPLKALAAGQWCDVTFNGSAWVLSGYGSL